MLPRLLIQLLEGMADLFSQAVSISELSSVLTERHPGARHRSKIPPESFTQVCTGAWGSSFPPTFCIRLLTSSQFKDVLTAFLGRAEADDWVKLGLKRSKSQRTNERAAPNEHEQYFRSALKQKSISEPGLTDRAYQLRQAFEVLVVATNQFTEKTAEWRDAFWDHGRKAIFTRESIKSIEKSVQVLWNGMCRASEGTEVCALQESFVLVVLAEVQHYLNDHDFYLGPRSKGQRVDSSVIDWMAKTIWGSEYSAHRERLRSKLREGRTRMQVQKTLGLGIFVVLGKLISQ